MATQWNKYEATAARKHGKPGREIRPKSTTIDIHSHVAIPQAAAYVKPHLDMSTIALAHFADARDQGAEPEAGRGHPRAHHRLRRAPADLDAMGIDLQLVMPPPNQCFYTVPLDIAVQATRMVNDGIAEYVARKPDRFVALGTVPLSRRRGSGEGARTLHDVARHEGRGDPHQCRRPGAFGAGLRAVLAEGRRARRARRHPSQRFHRRQTVHPLLFQQRDRQSARDHHRAALPDLRRRAGAAPQAEDSRGARRRLSCRPIPAASTTPGARARIAHGDLPQPPTSYLKKIYFDTVVFTPHQLAELVRQFGADHIIMGTDYPFDMADFDPIGHVASVEGFDASTIAAIAGGNARRILGL